jgi:hypothetical protein
LVTCDGHVSDYWNCHISKAAALAYIHTSLTNVLPEGSEAVEFPFSQYIAILENHDQFIAAAGVCGMREWLPSPEGDKEQEDEGERDVHQAHKRAHLDPRSDSSNWAYPWNMADGRHIFLSANLEKTWILLKLYTTDPKGAKSDLLNQQDCPEFPDGEWKNILTGHAVNLDNVLSGYYSISNNDNDIEVLGDLEFKVSSVTLNKIVSTTGDWSIAWNKTVQATIFAFPHRSRELAGYGFTLGQLPPVHHCF